ncbi:MAG: hypothetical protein Udaeo2_24960 [Candidatus Udaeobacter sp.]|jgi:hypothetical protein|nr:MAG: hypothetical protein Udaeo2_24960 [Candidatus Udaeobacter sp.]
MKASDSFKFVINNSGGDNTVTFDVKIDPPIGRGTRGLKRLFGGPDHAGWLPPEAATPLAAEAIR